MNVPALDTAIYTQLTGGTALTSLLGGTTSVYNSAVPPGVPYPVVVYQQTGGLDPNDNPNRRKELVYSVKAVSKMTPQKAGEVDAQIDARLHGQTLTVAGWANIWLRRIADITYTEVTPEGRYYFHSGGRYAVWLVKDS